MLRTRCSLPLLAATLALSGALTPSHGFLGQDGQPGTGLLGQDSEPTTPTTDPEAASVVEAEPEAWAPRPAGRGLQSDLHLLGLMHPSVQRAAASRRARRPTAVAIDELARSLRVSALDSPGPGAGTTINRATVRNLARRAHATLAKVAGDIQLRRGQAMPPDEPGPTMAQAAWISLGVEAMPRVPSWLRDRLLQETIYLFSGILHARPDGTLAAFEGGGFGLGRLTLREADQLGVDPFDPEQSVRGLATLIDRLVTRENGNVRRALGILFATRTRNLAQARRSLRHLLGRLRPLQPRIDALEGGGEGFQRLVRVRFTNMEAGKVAAILSDLAGSPIEMPRVVATGLVTLDVEQATIVEVLEQLADQTVSTVSYDGERALFEYNGPGI